MRRLLQMTVRLATREVFSARAGLCWAGAVACFAAALLLALAQAGGAAADPVGSTPPPPAEGEAALIRPAADEDAGAAGSGRAVARPEPARAITAD